MARKKLLLVTYYFPPCAASATYRALGLACHLPAAGWDVRVLAAQNVPYEPVDDGLMALVPDGVEVKRVSMPPVSIGSRGRNFILPLSSWVQPATRVADAMIEQERPDLVLTTSPPGAVHRIGRAIKKRWGIPWAACLRDAWVTNIEHFRRAAPFKLFELQQERLMMNSADLIIANTPSTTRGLQAAFPRYAPKIVMATNGFDPQLIPHFKSPSTSGDKQIVLVHAGELYHGRSPEALIAAMARLRAERPAQRVKLQLLGDATELDLPSMLLKYGMYRDVDAPGQVPYSAALQHIANADILVIIQIPTNLNAIPAKLYEYLGTGKPILVLSKPGGDIDWLLAKVGVTHEIAELWNADAVHTALSRLVDAIQSGQVKAASPEELNKFTRAAVARGLAGHLDNVLAKD